MNGRGIEASLLVWKDVSSGAFASEALRRRTGSLPESERILASSLVYLALRRAPLWKHMVREMTGRPLGKISPPAGDALVMGVAGVSELRNFSPKVLVNALVEWVKLNGAEREPGMVNAVLRKASIEGPEFLKKMKHSRNMRDMTLFSGVPGWAASIWTESWGKDKARDIVRLASMKAYMSLRVSPGKDPSVAINNLECAGYRAWSSPLLADSIRMSTSGHPPHLPGYPEGVITPQSESSIIVGNVARSIYRGGPVLDMCSGRGVKACQFLKALPESILEGWDLSAPRSRAAVSESERVNIAKGRFIARAGNALQMTPLSRPALVLLDAPCSGSGTWARHPEGKLRLFPERLNEMAALQSELLGRAIDLVEPGGSVLYSTCSLFRQENELVVAKVLEGRPGVVEMPPDNTYDCLIRGRPWGNYILPMLPWVDGFFITVLNKRA